MLATLAFVDIASFLDRIDRHQGQAFIAAFAAMVVLGIRAAQYLTKRVRPQHEEGILYIITSFVAAFFVGWFVWGAINLGIDDPEPLLYAPMDLDFREMFFGGKWRFFLLLLPIGAAVVAAAYSRERNRVMHKDGNKWWQYVQMIFWAVIAFIGAVYVIHFVPGAWEFLGSIREKLGSEDRGTGDIHIPRVTVPTVTLPPGVLPGTE